MPRIGRRVFAAWLLACVVGMARAAGPVVDQPLDDVTANVGDADKVIDLVPRFSDPDCPGTVVRFSTVLGDFLVELYDEAAPLTVENFLQYVSDGDYTDSIIHRLVAGFVLQGGGYWYPGWSEIDKDDPVVNEFGTSNTRGTLAMAKTAGDPDSATSEWFVNLADNSATLDTENGGYTVFGHVIMDGMDVVDALAAIPTYDFESDPWRELPLINYTDYPNEPAAENVVMVYDITVSSPLTFEVTNDNPTVVTASISNGKLTLHYTGNGRGVANITVRATDEEGLWVEDTFTVTVEGRPHASPDEAATDMGQPVSIAVLANDDGRGAALDPASLAIVTDPPNGAAAVDPVTHEVVYTPGGGFRGTDTFTYQVSDVTGLVSDPATVSVLVNGPPVVTDPLDDLRVNVNSPPTVIPLTEHFADPDRPGTTVSFSTVLGDFLVELFDDAAPLTVANFLHYVNDGDYAGTIVHRLVAGFVLQGGGYAYPGWSAIPTDPPVPNEFGISNTRGTLAMAKLGDDPNSATSQWFVNLADNSGTLDTQNGGFTVFGHVIGDGMTVVDALAAIPIYDFGWDPWRALPLINYTGFPNEEPGANNVVMVYDISVSSPLTFTVTNDNPALLTASVSNARLTLQYQADQTGIAQITVRATDERGLWVEDSFTVEVRRAPVAHDDTATAHDDDATPVPVLANDMAGDEPIDVATVTVVSAPAHGTAVPDPATGAVVYTAAGGYYGADSFTYKVADTGGWWSNVATVTLTVNAKPIVLAPIPDMLVEMGSSPTTVDLSLVFTDIEVRGHIAHFDTTLGQFDVELLDTQAPNTVANFRKYVSDGDYTSTLVHRVVADFVIQGGGYGYPSWSHIDEDAPIANEFGESNLRGTLAMAKLSGDPDSATSEWFFNLADNSASLDGENGGYTVFGEVMGNGMDVVDAIAAVPTYVFDSPYGELPLRDYTSYPSIPAKENVILVNAITVRTALTYTIILDTPGELLLNPTITDNTLGLALRPDQWGTGTVTIRATDMNGGSVETTFQVTVKGPPLANDDAPVTDPGVALDIPVLLNDVARGRAIDPTTVTIVDPPEHGTAVVDPATGVVTYTPPPGFIGPDPFTYRVRDVEGGLSNVATVNVAVNTPGYLIGTGHPGSLRYTDGDGTAVTVAAAGGVARVLLGGYPELVSQNARQIVVGGSQVRLYRLEMIESSTRTRVTFTTTGGTTPGATLGGLVGSAPLGTLAGAAMDLVGDGIGMTGAGYILACQLRDVLGGADIRMPGTGATGGVRLTLRNIPDPGTDMAFGSPLASLTLAQWAGSSLTAPSAYTIAAKGDATLGLPGDFGANVTLTRVVARQLTLQRATIAGRITGGTWNIAGPVGSILTGSSAAGWTLNAGGAVGNLSAKDLGGTLSAPSFTTVRATGEFTATLAATDTVASHTVVGSFLAGKVNAGKLLATGGIRAISVSDWVGGQLHAAWIGTLATTRTAGAGEIKNLDLVLSGAGNPRSALSAATFSGEVSDSTWTINGPVGTLRAGNVDGLNCAIWGKLTSFSFVAVTDTNLTVLGAIGSLQGTAWEGGSVQAYSLGYLTIRGDSVAQIHGNFTGAMYLSGEGVPAGRPTLGSARISYAIAYAEWNITGAVGSISAYIVQDWKLTATGTAQSLALTYVTRGEVSVAGTPGRLTTAQWFGGKLKADNLSTANLGMVTDLDATITNSIATLNVVYWVGGSITAKTIRTLRVTGLTAYGDFSPNLTLTGAAGVADTLGTLTVARRVLGGTWKVTGNIGTVDVFSLFQGCTVKATGNFRSLAVGAALNSVVHAGVADSVTRLPSTAADFTSSTASIQKFLVRGVPFETSTHSFINTVLASPVLGPATVLTVKTGNGGTPFGFAARTIQALTWKPGGATYIWPSRWPASTGDLVVRVVP